jgi:hypothetical protein
MTHTWQEPPVPPKLPPHVVMVRNKTGRPYLYLMRNRGTKRAGKAIRLPDDPRAPEFWTEYARYMNMPVVKRANLVSDLITAWHASAEWKQMAEKTRVDWSRYCLWINAGWGELQVSGIEPKHVLKLRDTYADRPASANNLIRCLSSMLSWSVPRGWRTDNPCREIKPLRGGEGYEPWPWEVIQQSRSELRADLWWAVALALYTGQRLGDVLAMRWSHIAAGKISVVQEKTGKRLLIPIHRDLLTVLETIPRRAVTILTNTDGVPWKSGFQATWGKNRPACASGLVFHGLRKSAVVTLLEAGCSTAEVAAITGQSLQMVEHYAKRVSQERLASAAILRWEQSSIANTVANTVAVKTAKSWSGREDLNPRPSAPKAVETDLSD